MTQGLGVLTDPPEDLTLVSSAHSLSTEPYVELQGNPVLSSLIHRHLQTYQHTLNMKDKNTFLKVQRECFTDPGNYSLSSSVISVWFCETGSHWVAGGALKIPPEWCHHTSCLWGLWLLWEPQLRDIICMQSFLPGLFLFTQGSQQSCIL